MMKSVQIYKTVIVSVITFFKTSKKAECKILGVYAKAHSIVACNFTPAAYGVVESC